MPSPHQPTKYLGPKTFLAPTVSRNRRPTGADVIQPETGKYYAITTLWQVGKDPTDGVEGEVWVLTKIVANVGYWEIITTSATGTVTGLRDSDGDEVGPDVDGFIDVIGDANSIITTDVDGVLPNTLRVNVKVAEATASTDITKDGVAAFSSAQFDVDANGFVTLSGTGSGQTITGDVGGALSPTAGNWDILGGTLAAGTSPVATSGLGSALTINVQRSQAIAAADSTKVGLCTFDSADFAVDVDGFVTLAGAGAGQTITGDTGGALSPSGGNWNILGSSIAAASTPVATSGSGSTLTVNVQEATTTASKTTASNGIAHFDSTYFSVDEGFVSSSTENYSFFAYNSADTASVTGDNTEVIIPFDTDSTPGWDPNSNFNTGTYKYTVPVTGEYEFEMGVRVEASAGNMAAHTRIVAFIYSRDGGGTAYNVLEGGNFSGAVAATLTQAPNPDGVSINLAGRLRLTAGYTVECRLQVDGVTKNVYIGGLAGATKVTYFSGRFISGT